MTWIDGNTGEVATGEVVTLIGGPADGTTLPVQSEITFVDAPVLPPPPGYVEGTPLPVWRYLRSDGWVGAPRD